MKYNRNPTTYHCYVFGNIYATKKKLKRMMRGAQKRIIHGSNNRNSGQYDRIV